MVNSDEQVSLPDVLEDVKMEEQRAQGTLYAYLETACYPNIERYLLKWGGEKEDAEDCFQQAIMVLFDAIVNGKFTLKTLSLKSHTSQLCSFVMAVCKNLWRKELRWRNRAPIQPEDSIEAVLIADIPASLVAEAFQKLGEACKKVLFLYYQEKVSAAKIAGKLDEETDVINERLKACTETLVKSVGSTLNQGQQEKLHELLSQGMEDLKEHCRAILTSFYFEQLSMAEIAEKLDYANAHSVTQQKNRCMKRLNEAIVSRMLNNKQA